MSTLAEFIVETCASINKYIRDATLLEIGSAVSFFQMFKKKKEKNPGWVGFGAYRVRTGYGILEKLWNFEKEIPYMEKLWNLSKTAVPMEKLWNFRFGGIKCVLSLRPDFEM